MALTKSVFVRQLDGISFTAKGDTNHWVMMDGPAAFGGHDAAARPSELLLMALGGCTGSDVASILKKKRIPLERLELRVTGAVEDEPPHAFASIHVEYHFYGNNLLAQDIERAIELSMTKYCSVSASLKPPVTHTYVIHETHSVPEAELA